MGRMAGSFERILIVSASVGAGHDQAASAIGAEIERRFPAARVTVADFMGEENSHLNALLKDTYLAMISLSPQIYDRLYHWTQTRQFPGVQNLLARTMKRSMLRLYLRHRPDLIVFTHPFPCGAAAYLRRSGKFDVPLVGVITDFSAHLMWVYDEVDLYFVAASETRAELVRLGVAAERVFPTGIPIDASFGRRQGRYTVAAGLGLAAGKPTVLIMGGGLGIGPVAETVSSLDGIAQTLQVIVVAGRNAELRREIRAIAASSRNRVVALGFTRRVRELMAAADLLITKPGALTVSEALCAGLPMVLIDPLPGQEEDNARYLVDREAAVLAAGGEEAARIVAGLLERPEEMAAMRRRAGSLGQPAAAGAAAGIIAAYLAARRRVAAGV